MFCTSVQNPLFPDISGRLSHQWMRRKQHVTSLWEEGVGQTVFVTTFRLHWIAGSSTSMFADLLLACYLANTTCAISGKIVCPTMTSVIPGFAENCRKSWEAFFAVQAGGKSLHQPLSSVPVSQSGPVPLISWRLVAGHHVQDPEVAGALAHTLHS